MSLLRYLLIFVLKFYIYCQNNILIETNEFIDKIDSEGIKFYTIKLDNSTKNLDLMLSVYPNDQGDQISDPDLYVSRTVKSPDTKNFDYYSNKIGKDQILIPYKELSNSAEIYFCVICSTKCNYKIVKLFQNDQELVPNQRITFQTIDNNLFTFKIPGERPEVLEIISYSSNFKHFEMLISRDSTPDNTNSLKIIPSFNGGYTCFISKSGNDYYPESKYQVLIKSKESQEINLLLRIQGAVINIKDNQPEYGSLEQFQRACYSYSIKDRSVPTNLIVSMTLYAGIADFTVNYFSLPLQKTSFAERYNMDEEETIKVSVQPSLNKNLNDLNIYFCIYANLTSSYFLNVVDEKKIEESIVYNNLIPGIPVVGYIPNLAVNAYKLSYFGYESEVTVSLNGYSGNTILKLFICQGIKCYFEPKKYKNSEYKMIESDNYFDKQIINLANDNNPCRSRVHSKIEQCSLFAVIECYGALECNYRVSYSHASTQTLLYENMPLYHSVESKKYNFYRLFIHNVKKVKSISIILSEISGQIKIITSLSDLDSRKEKSVKSTENILYNPETVIYTHDEILDSTDINIAITSKINTFYSIKYVVNYKDDIFSPIFLTNDVSSKEVLNKDDSIYNVYSFSNKNFPDNSKYIIITLTPILFEYDIYFYQCKEDVIYNFQNQTMEKYLLKSDSSQLIIDTTQSNYDFNSPNYIVITMKKKFLKDSNKGSFYLAVNFQNKPLILHDTIPNRMVLNELSSQNYKYYHNNKTNDAFIMINIFRGECSLSAKVVKVNGGSSEEFTSKQKGNLQSITLKSDNFKNSTNDCEISIKVNKISSICDFIISVDTPDSYIIIQPGVVYNREILPAENHTIYSILKKNDNGLILINTKEGELEIKAKLVSSSYLSDPTPFNLERGPHGFRGIIRQDMLTRCIYVCFVVIEVIGKHLETKNYYIEYSIILSTEINQIKLDQPYKESLQAGDWRYFKFNFQHKLSYLYISLMKNSFGDADIFVGYGDSRLPSFDDYDWKSNSIYSSFIELDPRDPFFNPNTRPMNNNYIIGVYAYKNTTFTLFVSDREDRLSKLSEGISSSCMTVKRFGKCYFRFETGIKIEKDKEFIPRTLFLKLDYIYGAGKVYADLFDPSKPAFVFPDKTHHIWSTDTQNRRNLLNITLDSKAFETKNLDFLDIIITVDCDIKCFFEIHAFIDNYRKINIIENNKEEIFLINKGQNSILSYTLENSPKVFFKTKLFEGEIEGTSSKFVKDEKRPEISLAYNLNENKTSYTGEFDSDSRCGNGNKCYLNTLITSEKKSIIQYHVKEESKLNEKFDVKRTTQISFNSNNRIKTGFIEVLDNYETIDVGLKPSFFSFLVSKMGIYVKLKIIKKKDFSKDIYSEEVNEKNAEFMVESIENNKNLLLNLPGVKLDDSNSELIPIYIISLKVEYLADVFGYLPFNLNIHPYSDDVSFITLEPNNEMFSQVKSEKYHYNIFDIEKTNNYDDILKVEISECYGKVNARVSNKIAYGDVNDAYLPHTFNYLLGKHEMVIRKPEENFYVIVESTEGEVTNICKLAKNLTGCKSQLVSVFSVKYTTLNSQENSILELENLGEITYDTLSVSSLMLNWGKVIKVNSKNMKRETESPRVKFTVYLSENQADFRSMSSVCFNHYNNQSKNFNVTENKTELQIENLESGKTYYINVLASVDQMETVAYIPIEVTMPRISRKVIIFLVAVIVTLVLLSIHFIRRERRISKRLELELGVKDPNAFVTGQQMDNVQEQKPTTKYGNLEEEIEKGSNVSSNGSKEQLDK